MPGSTSTVRRTTHDPASLQLRAVPEAPGGQRSGLVLRLRPSPMVRGASEEERVGGLELLTCPQGQVGGQEYQASSGPLAPCRNSTTSGGPYSATSSTRASWNCKSSEVTNAPASDQPTKIRSTLTLLLCAPAMTTEMTPTRVNLESLTQAPVTANLRGTRVASSTVSAKVAADFRARLAALVMSHSALLSASTPQSGAGTGVAPA